MPEWIAVVLLGIVEGVTEFLPVSSTGHLLLAQHWLPPQSDEFTTVIQCGAALALFAVFTDRLKQLCFRWREPATRDFFSKLGLAFLITGVGGLVLKKLDFSLPDRVTPVATATLLGGILFLVVENWLRGRPASDEITWRVAVAAGLAQLLAAVFPGTSRSGATILAALVLGVRRPAAAEFSFMLGIPTLLAAGGLEAVSALRSPPPGGIDWGMILLGSLVAAVTAFAVVKWLLRFVQTHTFVGFAWYRIVLGIALLTFVSDPPVSSEPAPATPAIISRPAPGAE